MNGKICSVQDCSIRVLCRGWCRKHYERWRRQGDPLKTITRSYVDICITKNPLYSHYYSMIARCYSPSNAGYAYYGGRGIKVCDRWLGVEGVRNFFNDIPKKPSPKHTLDRIGVNGDYQPDNVRWVDWATQNINRRIDYRNVSGIKGVTWSKPNKKWLAKLVRNKTQKYLGYYDSIEEAGVAIGKAIKASESATD